MTNRIAKQQNIVRLVWWLLLGGTLATVLFIRVRFLDIPLERDEGEYAYAGQLMLQGIPPYKLVYNLKFPGTYAAYALMMSIFGQTIRGIHFGLLLTNLFTIALIFFLGRRLMNILAGIAAAAAYAVLSIGPSVLGTAAHATNFVVLPVLGGALLLFDRQDRQSPVRLFASGILFSVGLLMKQPALFFVLFAILYLLVRDIRAGWKRILFRQLSFGAGLVLPFAITSLILWRAGVFDKFWFWTIDYSRQYGSLVPLHQAGPIFFHNAKDVIAAGWLLWLLAASGLVAGLWNKRTRDGTIFLGTFSLFSILAICPGFYFRPHYFVLVLPAVALLAATAVSIISELWRSIGGQVIAFFVFATAVVLPITYEKTFFFSLSPVEASREIYSESPFPESIKIADYLRDHTNGNDTIAVLGSEPEIYFYAHRRSATGYIYTYGLMEQQKYARRMQLEMIDEIKRGRPKYLVSVVMNDSWLERPGSERLIFDWANNYTAQNYRVIGFVNLVAHDRTDYYFGSVPESVPRLGNYILIYERKS